MAKKPMPPGLEEIYTKASQAFRAQVDSADGVRVDSLRDALWSQLEDLHHGGLIKLLIGEVLDYCPNYEMPDSTHSGSFPWPYSPRSMCKHMVYWVLLGVLVRDESLLSDLLERGFSVNPQTGHLKFPSIV